MRWVSMLMVLSAGKGCGKSELELLASRFPVVRKDPDSRCSISEIEIQKFGILCLPGSV